MSTRNTPKNIRTNGNNGASGSDGRTCKTNAKKVNVNSLRHNYVAVVVPMLTVNSDFFSNDVDDPNCPIDYQRTSETVQPQNPTKRLNPALATSAYKDFLLRNVENPVFSTMIQKAYTAIDSAV